MAQGQVWTCIEWDSVTESCSVEGWADPPPPSWSLTLEEGAAIGWTVGLLMAIGWGYRQLKRALDI